MFWMQKISREEFWYKSIKVYSLKVVDKKVNF
jgi:hypothetical protein